MLVQLVNLFNKIFFFKLYLLFKKGIVTIENPEKICAECPTSKNC